MGGFFKVPADNRDLNYDKYTVKGGHEVEEVEPYTSHNTPDLPFRDEEVASEALLIWRILPLMKNSRHRS
jgi:hypothetical protein